MLVSESGRSCEQSASQVHKLVCSDLSHLVELIIISLLLLLLSL